MYAPRQHRQEKKKPYSNFLALEQVEHEGPIMAPPVYSATGQIVESEEKQEAKEEKKKSTPAVKEATEQNAVQNNRQQESEGGESENESETATESKSVKKSAVGRSEAPPQFKLQAGAPFQFKFASAPIQMKAGNGAGSGGRSNSGIPDHVKSQMEGSFGTSFDDVKVTANSNAAKDAGALAFAQGNNIHFAPGQFNPESKGGQELLGHELAHVVQQRQGRVQANAEVSGMPVNNDRGLEAEADSMGAKAAQFKADSSASVQKMSAGGSGAGAVQMKLDPNAEPKSEQQAEAKEQEAETTEHENQESAHEHGNLDDHLALDGFDKRPEETEETKEDENEDGNQDALAKGDKPENGEVESPENENQEASETQAGNETEAGETTENEGEEQAKDELEDKAKDAGETEEPESEEAEEAKEEAEGKEGENQESKSEAPAEGEANPGAKGAEAANGGGGGGAGAGGDAVASGGGESGGGAAEAGGGAAPIVVMPAERGNFGEGEEPDLMVVNEEAVGEFDSKRIIKNNGDGTYIVVSGTPSVSDASSSDLPVQMADDSTKKKPIKKKLSKSQGKEMFAANREKTKSYLAEFEAAAKSKIATLEGAKGSISGQVNSGASAAKAAILSAAAAEKSRVEGAFEAHKSALLADAERIKAETRAQMQTSVGLVQTAAETARTNVEAEFTTQDAAFVALEPVQKAKFTAAFDKGREDMIKAAEELGKIAIEKGEAKAQEYEAMPIPEQSWDEDLLNGSEYEKDRHNARVKAAREVGKSYADQFMQKAKEEGDKLKGSGEAELHKYVTDSVTASRDGIAQRKQAAFDEITAHETGAIQTLQTNCEATVAGIDAAAQGGVAALDQQKAQALGQIDTTAQGKMQAVDAVAQEKIANLESQVQSSIDALTNQMNITISGVSSRKNPNAEAVHGQLQGALQGIEGGVQSSMTTIDGGIMASIEGLNGTATETATEMNTAATAFIDGGASMKTTLVTNLEGQRDGFKTAATTIADGASTSMTLSAESAAKDMQDQYKAVTADFDKAQAGLDAKMTENSAAFKANIQEQLNGIDAKIKEEADKAYDAVQPRWVSWLLTAIDILVMIIITAVVLIAVASGVGILGLLLIGAVAGAIGGAIKYGARVGLTSEEASWAGLGTEMLNGAVDGLNIAVGMIPGLGPVASALSQIGMGALGGAIKYGGDCLINGKEFSWSALGGKVFLGGLEGAMGMIGGKAGDGVSNFLTKKIGTEAMEKLGNRIIVDVAKTGTEAMFDTVNGGLQNMFESYFETGTLDFGKFTEKLTVGEFLTNAATSKVTDFGAGKISDGAISHFNITPKTDGGSSNDPTNGSQSETVGGDNTTTNKSENVGGDNTPVNTDQTNNVGGDTTPPVNDAPVNSDQTNNIGDGNNSTPETQNNTLSGDGKNKDSNTDPANQGGDTPVLVPPVNQSPTTADTNPTPDPSKTNGQKQAEAKGYPPAPNGFEWVAKSDGTPYLRRQSGNADSLPQVRYDAATGQFTPVKSAPDGYHWKYENGAFSIHPNGNAGDLPPMQYDPTTQGFMTADGKPYNGDITTLAVRGQDFDGFVKSVRDPNFDADTAKQAYELYAKKDWAALEKLFTDKGLNGGWPPNRGFIDMKPGTLKAGDTFDRFGGRIDPVTGKFTDTGRFVAPFGADFGGRALPQTHLDGDPVTGDKPAFKGYKILKDIPMMEGDAIPWFGQPGGGKQYELPPGGIDKLIADGYIVEITAPNLHGKTDGDGVTNDADNTDGGGGLTP
ncbi:MAG TPA: DUF4157 domain-containing protein, partial [Bacteroidia bacterium]|nr:DUF4157 domain-containing protein [Bacteroidia bacterium]